MTKTEVEESRDSFISLLEKSEEYILPEKRREFERQVELTLLIIETLITDPVSIFKDLGELLERSEEYILPEKRREFAGQLKLALLHSKITLIEALSKETSSNFKTPEFDLNKEWHELRAKSETLFRRLQLLSPTTQEDFEATLMWVAERGVKEDLNLLRQLKHNPPYSSERISELFVIAEHRINERINKPHEDFSTFFEMSSEELTHLISIRTSNVVDDLSMIQESLKALFEPEEVKRWLHAPNSNFDGKTPRQIITEGKTDLVLEILVGLEEGLHN